MATTLWQAISTAAAGAALGMFLAGQTMAEPLGRPATVPLDFLGWIKRDTAWLTGILAGQDLANAVTLAPEGLLVSTSEALKAVNRIRAFAHLAAPGIRPPYFDLMLTDAKGQPIRCTTLFPQSVVPAVGPLDFAEPALSAEGADPVALDLCRVDAAKAAPYADLGRDAFRERYFDMAGDLRTEFRALNTDPAFIAAAFDHGFFLRQGDVTGRLKLERE